MDHDAMRLDGNALAGALAQVFAGEVTAARARCSRCGRVAAVGSQHLYRHPRAPGAVLRCAACDNVLLVLVERPDFCTLSMPGMSLIALEPR
jgi:Family of unknown function (DUF6510)